MPTIFNEKGFKFYFYMNEHLPIHVHVFKGNATAKIELVPEIKLIKNRGFKTQELKNIIELIIDHYDIIINKWYETFN